MPADEQHRADGVFEGGGVKGIAFAGAIEADLRAGISTEPERQRDPGSKRSMALQKASRGRGGFPLNGRRQNRNARGDGLPGLCSLRDRDARR